MDKDFDKFIDRINVDELCKDFAETLKSNSHNNVINLDNIVDVIPVIALSIAVSILKEYHAWMNEDC